MKKEDISILREKFIKSYCKSKGWDERILKTGQMMEIINQAEYKKPKELK